MRSKQYFKDTVYDKKGYGWIGYQVEKFET